MINLFSKKLMLPLKKGTILFENSTPGTYQVALKGGLYQVTITGGGGGCSNPSKHSVTASGGSAAGFIGTVRFAKGVYSIAVGNPGAGTNGGGGRGGTSSIKLNNITLIDCQGGEVGYLDSRGGYGGVLTLNDSLNVVDFSVKSNGHNGQGWYGGGGEAGVSVLNNSVSGYGAGTYGGWSGSLPGNNGYLKIMYVG